MSRYNIYIFTIWNNTNIEIYIGIYVYIFVYIYGYHMKFLS